MKGNRISIHFAAIIVTVALNLAATTASAGTYNILHVFQPTGDPYNPYTALIEDSAGNRYGTSFSSGANGVGAVFELIPMQGGGWTEKVLYSFRNDGVDGTKPYGTLVFDNNGNLYGTAASGGIHGRGAVFELMPQQNGTWTEKVLHSFGNGSDGAYPYGGVIFDGSGNLDGSTYSGGIHGYGTVFQLAPQQNGTWTETVLHSFGNGNDGEYTYSGLLLDPNGNLFGTTLYGGTHDYGAVFELSPQQGGGYTETVLHSFGDGEDGTYPYAGLVRDSGGNLYGTTSEGGIHDSGAVFALSPDGSGGYSEQLLHSFNYYGGDGAYPESALFMDSGGNLYGTATEGGIHGWGAVFELSPNGGGWTETTLHSFNSNGVDGGLPYAQLSRDGAGDLYSTTFVGGASNTGAMFQLTPRQGGGWTESVPFSFVPNLVDGSGSYSGLLVDRNGNLYGTTTSGGAYNAGTVFELSPQQGGGWTEKILHSFRPTPNGSDGTEPWAGLIMDGSGNLYGTTEYGGIHSKGVVFELIPQEDGTWTEKTLHSFGGANDGANLFCTLILDTAGNLYGTTEDGGIHGYGTVFELSPNGGSWTETILHSFNENGQDGAAPQAGLFLDGAGNLYGTTVQGGIHCSPSGCGTVFELSPSEGGGWTETVLHSFNDDGSDGYAAYASLIMDDAGDLLGTTLFGGIHRSGTAFQLTPQRGGTWSETLLHSFGNGSDAFWPYSGLIMDTHGNLYGAGSAGGLHRDGAVFELVQQQNETWSPTLLHSFGNGSDGYYSYGPVAFDSTGNLYGTTALGGGFFNVGVVYEITP